MLAPELDDEEKRYIYSCINLANRHNLPNLIVTEQEYKTTIPIWDTNVNIIWHVDWLVDEDYIVDIKSAKQKWKEEALLYKLQRRMYPVLFALARYPVERLHEINMKFDYWIFTKQVTPQFQWLRINVNVWEYYNQIQAIVKDYVMSLKTGVYNTNIKSPYCYRCPL